LLAAIESEKDHRLMQHVEQLRRIARAGRQTRHNQNRHDQARHDDDALLMSVLAGFPDRVARLRAGNQVLLSTGASAEVAGEPPRYEFMIAVDAEDRKDKPLPLIRMTSRIEPEWLIDLFPDRVREQSGVTWNRSTERVEAVSALLYDELVIQQSRGAVPNAEAAAELLAQKALEAGIERFIDMDILNDFMGRVEFAGFELPDVPQALRDLCLGLRSFAELKSAAVNFVPALEQKMAVQRLNEVAPARLRLQGGRQTKVHYERGKPPWIASRLQDFFGMCDTPRIGPERTPVVVHLLAPNQRAVQTTTDLAGFWERLYPQVRRELMRRYPRHAWPERP
jgi:ATP-dependent helicase HrpB